MITDAIRIKCCKAKCRFNAVSELLQNIKYDTTNNGIGYLNNEGEFQITIVIDKVVIAEFYTNEDELDVWQWYDREAEITKTRYAIGDIFNTVDDEIIIDGVIRLNSLIGLVSYELDLDGIIVIDDDDEEMSTFIGFKIPDGDMRIDIDHRINTMDIHPFTNDEIYTGYN